MTYKDWSLYSKIRYLLLCIYRSSARRKELTYFFFLSYHGVDSLVERCIAGLELGGWLGLVGLGLERR